MLPVEGEVSSGAGILANRRSKSAAAREHGTVASQLAPRDDGTSWHALIVQKVSAIIHGEDRLGSLLFDKLIPTYFLCDRREPRYWIDPWLLLQEIVAAEQLHLEHRSLAFLIFHNGGWR